MITARSVRKSLHCAGKEQESTPCHFPVHDTKGAKKRGGLSWVVVVALTVVMLAIVSACSRYGHDQSGLETRYFPPDTDDAVGEDKNWWSCKFKISWPQERKADFTVDLLLAHAVAAPALLAHRLDIDYWRFHRRASEDEAGHQFSLFFFAGAETAASVYAQVDENRILKEALEDGLVEKRIIDDIGSPHQSHIGDTSDESWSQDLQNNWPLFIMGVSALWLGLIDDSFAGAPADYADVDELLGQYAQAEEKIDEIWRKEGDHAFFHHLNAIFGYNPLLMRF